jgi:hypothetical protein
MRVCQFRHDGKQCSDPRRPPSRKEQLFYSTEERLPVKPQPRLPFISLYPSSFAVIVMLALRTLETGHPVLAFSAAF